MSDPNWDVSYTAHVHAPTAEQAIERIKTENGHHGQWTAVENSHPADRARLELVRDQKALNQIADLLNQPGRWSYDHLDDIAAILRRTGRKVG